MKKNFTSRYLIIAFILSLSLSNLFGQVSITGAGIAFTENFDGMGATGTTTPTGWFVGIASTASLSTVTFGTGSSNSGGNYNFGVGGTNSVTERALGSLAASSTIRNTEARFINNTGSVIASITISYDGEQWRLGQNVSNETGLVLYYSTDGIAFIAMGTSYNFTPAIVNGTAGPLDGNATANRISGIGGTYTPSSVIPSGATFYLRWVDIDNAGSDAASAIDNFSIIAAAAVSSDATLSNLTISAGAITPAFSPAILSYTSSVANGVTSTTITPTSTNANSTIKVNGVTVISGSASNSIPLNVGSNVINTVVTAQDGTTIKTYSVNITRAAASTPIINTTSALSGFGNVCINTTTPANSFTLDGSFLDGTPISVSALPGFTFSQTTGGPYTNTLSFTYTGNSFTGKTIYVKFSPTTVQSYDGNIFLNGGGVSNYAVAASGSGINTAPAVTTTGSSNITATSATLSGSVIAGCSNITSYGFEYSTNTGFVNGSGTQILSSNISGGNFTAVLTSLAPNTRYYFKAFAVSSGGTAYGAQFAFTCTPLPVVMSAQPGLSFTETFADIANWSNFFINGAGANHFSGPGALGSGGIPNGTTLTASTLSFQNPNAGPPVTPSSSGGVHRGTDQIPPTESIVLLSTGSPDNTTAAAIDFYIDFTGLNANTLSFDYAVINNSTGDRNGSLRVYGSTDGISFTELTNAAVLNFTNNVALSGTKTNVQLPALFNNSPNARLRFYYYNGTGGTTGSRPKISIDNLNVTAISTTPCTNPTAPATGLNFGTVTDVSIQGSFTAANPATDSYIIIMSANSNLISNPINGQTYNIGDNVGDGTVISKGTATNFSATALTAQTTYYFFVFPMNAVCIGGPRYYTNNILTGNATTLAGLPSCAAPLSQPGNLIFGTTATNNIAGSFTATAANEYLVIRSTSSSLSNNPVNTQVYNSGDAVGNGIVIQRSPAALFTANGLTPNTAYFFFIYSLNSQSCVNGPVYNTASPLTGSQSTNPLPPCVAPSAQPTVLALTASNTSVSGTFTGASGADNYLIIQSTSPLLGASPSNNIDYNPGDVLGNGIVIKTTPSTTFAMNGVLSNTTYYFFIFAANKLCAGGTKYNTVSPLTGNITPISSSANNYYFGTLHSHSDYSDGNADNPGFTPAQDYEYAKNSLCMDYLGISEHNHFSSPNNPGNQVNNYHLGSIQANNYTSSNSNFLALYGMEWGVISGGGHVVVYGDGLDDLWGWETGSGTWGPTNNYDVFVPKSIYTGTTGLFKTVNDNILKNTFATLAHPNLTDYNNIAGTAYNTGADSAIVGAAVESGPAFSTNTSYSNPASPLSYLYYYQLLLAKGYHLGPTIDHDNHNTTFGRTTKSRTAIVAPVLTKTAIVGAMRNMNFYATQDCDTRVDFNINTKIMGSFITDRFGPNISVLLTDPTTSVSSAIIRVMYGEPASGITAVKIDSAIGSTLSFTDNSIANFATGYYYLDISNGASRIITAPIWYTRNDNALPGKLNSFTVQKAGSAAQLDWSTEQEVNTAYFNVEKSADGRNWITLFRVYAAGNSSVPKYYKAFDYSPLNGLNYYRLKQFNLAGNFEYSPVKNISFNKQYGITPNPAKDFFIISVDKKINETISIEIIDITGKVVRKFSSLQSIVNVSTTGMVKGMYFVKILGESNQSTQKVIIQ